MTEGPAVLVRYRRALAASHRVEDVQRAVREAAERRIAEEAALTELYRELDNVTGVNPATWWPRITGRIRDRQAAVSAAIVEQEARTSTAVSAHERVLQQALDVNSLADDLPAARTAAAEALEGEARDEAQNLVHELAQIRSSLETIARARLLASEMNSSLARAGGWSTYDTWLGGGLMSSAIKHDYIDDANARGASLTELLTSLRPQLQELGAPTAYFTTNARDLAGVTDVWFDNIFSDVTMQGRIDESGARATQLLQGLGRLADQLGQRHQAIVRQLDQLLAPTDSSGTTFQGSPLA